MSAACSACRVPDPSSRSTSGVAASSAGRTGDLRRAHGWSGRTTTASRSVATTRDRSPRGGAGPSTKPRSASRSLTRVATASLFAATRVTSAGARPACSYSPRSATSQLGSRCSATVRLDATRSWASRARRRLAMPVSSWPASASSGAAQSTTSRPAGVSRDPRGSRSSSTAPTCASIARSRADAACWLIPACRAAAPMLPYRATAANSSRAVSSGTCGLSGTLPTIDRSQQLVVGWQGQAGYQAAPPGRRLEW